MKILAYLILSVACCAQAASTAGDPFSKNLQVQGAYKDDHGGTLVRFKYQLPADFGSTNKPATPNPAFVDSNLTFYCKSERCDQLVETSSSDASDGNLEVSFAGIDGSKGVYSADKRKGVYALTCAGDVKSALHSMSQQQINSLQTSLRTGKVPAYSLPESARRVEYVNQIGDQYIYVDSAKYNSSNDSFKFYIGAVGNMTESKIKRVTRYRDGGTTVITLQDGRIFTSPAFHPDAVTFDQKAATAVVKNQAIVAKLAPKKKPERVVANSPCPAAPTELAAPGASAAKKSSRSAN